MLEFVTLESRVIKYPCWTTWGKGCFLTKKNGLEAILSQDGRRKILDTFHWAHSSDSLIY